MEVQTIQAQTRNQKGKGPARQLRMQGLIPAVFYGPGTSATPVAVSPKDLQHAISTEHGRNAIMKLQIDGREELVIVKELQMDPFHKEFMHADFYRVEWDRPIVVRVPLVPLGRAVGVTKGGEQSISFRTVPVRATPDKLPARIEVDVTPLELNQVIQVKDLPLPEGVEVVMSPTQTLISVHTERKRAEEEETPTVAAAAEGAPAAEGEAPAASDEGEKKEDKK